MNKAISYIDRAKATSERIEKQELLSFNGCKDILTKLVERSNYKVIGIKQTKQGCSVDYILQCKDKDNKTNYYIWEQKNRTSTKENRKRYHYSELKSDKLRRIYQVVNKIMEQLKEKGALVPREQIHVMYIQMLYQNGATYEYIDCNNERFMLFDGISWDQMMIYNLDSIKWNELGVSVRPQRQTQYNDYSRMQIDEIYQILYSKGLCYDKESDKLCRI